MVLSRSIHHHIAALATLFNRQRRDWGAVSLTSVNRQALAVFLCNDFDRAITSVRFKVGRLIRHQVAAANQVVLLVK